MVIRMNQEKILAVLHGFEPLSIFDEPLLYCLDRILGLLLTFNIDNIKDELSNIKTENSIYNPVNEIYSIQDSDDNIKNQSSNFTRENSIIVPVNEIHSIQDNDEENIVHMTVDKITNCDMSTVTTDNLKKDQSLNANDDIVISHSSSKQHIKYDKPNTICNDVENEVNPVESISGINNAILEHPISNSKPVIFNDLIDNDVIAFYNKISSLRKLVKKTSSMECLYSISETKIEKNKMKSKPNFALKKNEKIVFTDKTTNNLSQKTEQVKCPLKILPQQNDNQKNTESKFRNFVSRIERCVGTKTHFVPLVKEKSTREYLSTLQEDMKNNCEKIGDFKGSTHEPDNSITNQIKVVNCTKKTKFVVAYPKVIKTEWACTRIRTFDDRSQTYEVMKKDENFPSVNEKKSVQRIFAISPNSTTVAYRPLNYK